MAVIQNGGRKVDALNCVRPAKQDLSVIQLVQIVRVAQLDVRNDIALQAFLSGDNMRAGESDRAGPARGAYPAARRHSMKQKRRRLSLKKKRHDSPRLRGMISAAALAILVAATVWTARKPDIVAAIAPTRQLPVYCVERADKKIAISFDAAWGNEDTQTLIDILKEHDVRATFFLVGGWVDKYPDSVKALADAGNEIMNHSETHPHLAQLSAEEVKAEVNTCSDKIEAITGVRPTLFRCPYGEYNDTAWSPSSGTSSVPKELKTVVNQRFFAFLQFKNPGFRNTHRNLIIRESSTVQDTRFPGSARCFDIIMCWKN